ncbi:MAG: hypothetical protein PHS27_01230 [Candidatus Pacebacteria bacterium]|nr:hypothetical protein [Candidatus Paceibacterota bacterium]
MQYNNIDWFKSKYGHEVGGFWVPRVTAITDIINKPALLKYYAQQESFEAAQALLRNSANWGTKTHAAVEQLLKGEGIEPDAQIAPSIQAFHDWFSQYNVSILDPDQDIERMIFDPENYYSGRMDALVEINGELGILDIKTGTGIWEEYYLQTAAYLNAYNKTAPSQRIANKRWILRIEQYQECVSCGAKKRGKSGTDVIKGGNPYCTHQFSPEKGIFEFKDLEDNENDIKAFLNAQELWEWYNQDNLRKIKNYPKKLKYE